MSFKVLFMAHSPDAQWDAHQTKIDTGKFILWTVVVKDQGEALSVARKIHQERGLDSILLCPGFTQVDVVEIVNAFDGQVGVSVARGDGLSNQIAAAARQRAYGG
jgi:hypothetical protein